jgi:hypothetical protein
LLVLVAGAVPAGASTSGVVISEFRFRGPVGGNDEFVELVNAGASSVPIGGWKLQGCASATGTASDRVAVPAGVVLAPGQHYLFTNNNATGGYSGSVPGDTNYGTGFTDGAGARITLADGTPVDGVGGTGIGGTQCREGTGITGMPTTNGDQSYERVGGTLDTDNNATDFLGPKPGNPQKFGATGSDAAPSVSNTSPANGAVDVARSANVSITFSEPVTTTGAAFVISCNVSGAHPFAPSGGPTTFTLDPTTDFAVADTCTVTVDKDEVTDVDGDDPPDAMTADHAFTFSTTAPTRRIFEIQGASHLSPYAGQLVSGVPGVITAVRPQSFYFQDAAGDGNDATSDAVLVFLGSSTAGLSVGQAVLVSGTVTEFRPGGASSTNLTTTEITGPAVTPGGPGAAIAATVIGAGGRVPPTEVIEDDATGSVETSGVFDPASDGIDFYESLEATLVQVNDPLVTGPTNGFGEIWVVGDGGAAAALLTTRNGIVIRPNDFNPERIQLDDEIIGSNTNPLVNVGDTFTTSPKGVLEYNFGNFEILLTSALTRVDNGLVREVTEPAKKKQLTVANFNVENLDPGDPPSKFAELAGLIVDHLLSPDIIAIEEIQDNNGPVNDTTVDASLTYQTLIAAIQAAGGPVYDFRDIPPVDDQDGGEPGGNIRVGFLFRTDVEDLSFRDRPGATSVTPNAVVDAHHGPHLLFSPGRIDPTNPAFNSSRKPLAGEFLYKNKRLILIANHFNSKGGDQPLFGRFQPPVRSSEVQRHQQAQIVNDFVDQILAADEKANVIVLGDLNDFEFSTTVDIAEGGVLTALMETLPGPERYSYVFEGNSQSLDHMLVSHELLKHKPVFDAVHVNAEFAQQSSDHDPQVAKLDVHGRAVPPRER